MEKKFKRTTVTSALPYANGPVHIGHLAGVYVPADIYVRYLRFGRARGTYHDSCQERRNYSAGCSRPLSFADKKIIRRIRYLIRRV